MSQSFCFLNTETNDVSQVLFPFEVSSEELPWEEEDPYTSLARNLDSAPRPQWVTYFDYARELNGWGDEPLILAVGDYTTLLYDYGSIGHPEEPGVRFASGHDESSDYTWVWDSED